jgi:hypothetical protein
MIIKTFAACVVNREQTKCRIRATGRENKLLTLVLFIPNVSKKNVSAPTRHCRIKNDHSIYIDLFIANKHMTSTERDKLAKLCGAKIKHIPATGAVYEWPGGFRITAKFWHPESSLDDCRPLLDEIERRGLWNQFVAALAMATYDDDDEGEKEYSLLGTYARWLFCLTKPADIVAAFEKVMQNAPAE